MSLRQCRFLLQKQKLCCNFRTMGYISWIKIVKHLFFAFLLRWTSLNWEWQLRGCFLVEEIRDLILLASAWLELAQRSPCHLVQGLTQVSSPYSGAFGFQCCFLGLAGHFPLQILKLQNDKKTQPPKHISTDIGEDPLKLRKSYSPRFFFQHGTRVRGGEGEGCLFTLG